MKRPRALDLFCCAGGASTGLWRAGFEVFGVDHKTQPRYPFWFRLGDALQVDPSDFDFIWASPPCEAFSQVTPPKWKGTHPDLIAETRALLASSGALTVIENVPLAPIRPDLVLTGNMFGLRLIRRRHFETNFAVEAPGPVLSGRGLVKQGLAETVAGGGRGVSVIKRWSEAMGIDWMTRRELAQAIPPAYAEHIGRAAIDFLRTGAGLAKQASADVGLAKQTLDDGVSVQHS